MTEQPADSRITINGDEILTKHHAWKSGEESDSSNAGKRREAIGSYCEKNGIENKAFSQIRTGLKIKNAGKRRDWLRSMQLLLPVAEREVFDNDPELELEDTGREEREAAASDAIAEQSDEMAANIISEDEYPEPLPPENDPIPFERSHA